MSDLININIIDLGHLLMHAPAWKSGIVALVGGSLLLTALAAAIFFIVCFFGAIKSIYEYLRYHMHKDLIDFGSGLAITAGSAFIAGLCLFSTVLLISWL